jgi:broad specificity phosphatase PhoE
MKIHILRHGQTDSNLARKLLGRKDEPLNDEGRKQAEEMGEELKDKKFNLIITSPLKRSTETADIINKNLNLPIIVSDKIVERDFGVLTGLTWKEIEEKTGKNVEPDDLHQRYDYTEFGGESVKDVRERLEVFLNEVRNKYLDKNVLVVAHGGILKLMTHLFIHQDGIHPKNISLHEFEI